MSLIKSISGIRGTIGGKPGDGLSPIDVVKFTTAFATFLKNRTGKRLTLVVGRDARMSGDMVDRLVVGTLLGMGVDVIETGLSTTPTTEMAVINKHADGGIIITASHNPKHWNALKLLNERGEFIDAAEGAEVLRLAESDELKYADVDDLGTLREDYTTIDQHIEKVLKLKLVDREEIRHAGFRVAVDAVNSTGGLAIPRLLRALGVQDVVELNCNPTGNFAHNPEPIPENLTDISRVVRENKCDLGIVVDPDVDRLALVCENGEMFGEEYTLVSVADYVLQNTPGNTVSNLSSSRALRDVTHRYAGCEYNAAAVGEVNVTTLMRQTGAVIGGEGNGGVIYPELHYGRDALVGVALFLTLLAKKGLEMSELRKTYPEYVISKNRIELNEGMDVDGLLKRLAEKYSADPTCKVTTIDGVKIDFEDGWVHLRKSNTEPIIRIYSEANTEVRASELALQVKLEV
ncbi:MAG: phosphoglucosamine mutase [Bacteroidales bacterium]|jgi:phosphomannomutase|nr:phosphoglucosamine mutase [Bacteroidales bacterium]